MRAHGGFLSSLQQLLILMAPPYGFTLATFTAGGVTIYYHAAPHPLEILLFLVGAFLGYAALGVLTLSLHTVLTPTGIAMRGWQMLHVVPLAIVFLLAWGSALWVPSPMSWFTSGLALTTGYLLGLTTVLQLSSAGDGVREVADVG